jgi:hypothetical protein
MLMEMIRETNKSHFKNNLNHLKSGSDASILKLDPVALHHTASAFLALLKIR